MYQAVVVLVKVSPIIWTCVTRPALQVWRVWARDYKRSKFGHVSIAHLNSLLYANASYAFHALKKANKQEIKKFLQKGWPVILHLKKAKEQGEMPLPSLGPIPQFYIFKWDGNVA